MRCPNLPSTSVVSETAKKVTRNMISVRDEVSPCGVSGDHVGEEPGFPTLVAMTRSQPLSSSVGCCQRKSSGDWVHSPLPRSNKVPPLPCSVSGGPQGTVVRHSYPSQPGRYQWVTVRTKNSHSNPTVMRRGPSGLCSQWKPSEEPRFLPPPGSDEAVPRSSCGIVPEKPA